MGSLTFLHCNKWEPHTAMFPPLISPDNLAILQKAIDAALGIAARRKAKITVNELAAQMWSAYAAGERDPAKLAEAAFVRREELALG